MRKIINKFLVLTLCFSMMSTSIHATDNIYTEVDNSTVEETFVVDEISETGDESNAFQGSLSYVDVDYDTSSFTVKDDIPANYAALPASYSLRSTMPALRNQNPYGSCWAHAAIASAENSAIRQNLVNTSVDLSELALAYFFYNRKDGDEPLGLTNGDYTKNIGSTFLDRGGNSLFTTFALAGRMGYINESYLPYSYAKNVLNGSYSVNRSLAYKYNSLVIDDIKWANMSDPTSVKSIIKNYGAMAVSYYHDDTYYNSSTYGYYNNKQTTTNHAVTIVGWNDNFSKNNFKVKPKNNGAWLIRNSWGSNWGDGGYFWISYEDTSIKNGTAFQFNVSAADSSEYLYQYDGSNGLGSYQSTGSIHGANIFTAKRDEVLDRVGFFTNETNVGYTVRIYKNVTNGPQKGTLVSQTSGKVTYAGYHTVDLGKDVELPAGTKFSIVVTLTAASSSSKVSMMRDYSYTNGDWIQFISKSSSGQSYYATASGSWQDVSSKGNINIRIKGYTKPIYNISSSNVLTDYNGTAVNLTLPSNIVEIQSKSSANLGVFAYRDLISVTLPSALKIVGNYAFYENSLSKINLPANIKTIGNYAFAYNDLKNIYLPKSLTSIASNAFYGNSNAYYYVYNGSYAHTWAKSYASGKFYAIPTSFTGNIIPVETVRMNTTRMSMSVNQTKKLSVTYSPSNATICNSVTWRSDNPNVATVDSSGNVKLIAEGTATIYATTPNGLVASCFVEYGFGPTRINSITRASSSSLKLSWNKIPDAKGYVIYRSTDNKKFSKVATVSKASTVSWTNTKLSTNKNYYYYVQPYTTENGKTVYADKSNVMRGILLKTPSVTAKSASYNSVELSWPAVSNATYYEVYRSTSEKGTYGLILGTPNTTYTDTNLTTNQTYYYKVLARTFDSLTDISSANSTVKSAKPVLASTSFTKSEGDNTGKISLAWNSVNGATKYEVYRSTSSSKGFTIVYTGNKTSYVDSVTKGTVYYYKVRPVRVSGSQTYTGSYSSVKSVVSMDSPTISVSRTKDTALKVSWNKVSGASGYVVYRSSDGVEYKSVATITKGSTTSWTNEKLKNGTHYWYYVKAYKTVGKSKVYSMASNVMETVPLKTPSVTATCTSYQAITVSWKEIPSANQYEIYRSTSEKGEYSLVYTTSGTSWKNTGLTTNQKYYYKVRAVAKVAQGTFVGSYSSVKNAKPILTSTSFTSHSGDGNGNITLSWSSVEGATSYQVYRSTSSKGKFEPVFDAYQTKFVDKVDLGVTYYYQVRPVRKAGGQVQYGAFSSTYSATTIMKPEIKIQSLNYDTVDVSWNTVAKASGYEVYRATSSSGKYSKVATVEAPLTHAEITKLTAGKNYYYKVRAYRTIADSKKYSPYSTVVKGASIPNTPVISVEPATTAVKVSWEKVSGASGYEIYRSTSQDGKYTKVTTVNSKSTSYSNTKLSAKTKYYYKVRAYKTVSNKKVYSSYSSILAEYPNPATVTGVSVTAVNERELKVSWKKVTDATAYQVIRLNDAGGNDFIAMVPAETLSYTDTNRVFYKEYTYKVRALRSNEGKTYIGAMSTGVKQKTKVSTPKPTLIEPILMNALSFEFEDQKEADGFEISMKKDSKGKYSVIFDGAKSSLSSFTSNGIKYYYTINQNLSLNKTYYYRVRAYKYASDGTKVFSSYATEMSKKTTPVTNIGGKYPKTLNFDAGGYIKATSASFSVSNINTYSNTCDLKLRINYSKVYAPNYNNRIRINFYDYLGTQYTWYVDYHFNKVNVGKGYADCTFYDVPLSYVYYSYAVQTSPTYSANNKKFDIEIPENNTVFETEGYGY